MPLPPEFFLGLLTPSVAPPQGLDFSGIHQAGAAMRDRKRLAMEAEQRKQQLEADAAKRALDQQKHQLEQAKYEAQRQEKFQAVLGDLMPDMVSGAPMRVQQAEARLLAAGGTIQDGAAPSPLGLDSADLSFLSPDADMGEWLDSALAGENKPDTSRTILDPLGVNVMSGYDPEENFDANRQVILDAAMSMAGPYLAEFPTEAALVIEAANDAADGVLSSPGGTVEKGIEYVRDLLDERLGPRFGSMNAAMMASGGQEGVLDSLEWQRGNGAAQQFTSNIQNGMLSRAEGSKSAQSALNVLQKQINEQEQTTQEIDKSLFVSLIYELVKMNGEVRPTEADFQRAFDGATTIEDIRNTLSGSLGLDPDDYLGSLFRGEFLTRNGTVTTQTARRLFDTMLTRYDAMLGRIEDDKERLKMKHSEMIDSGLYGYANGYASYVNGMYGQKLLPIIRPEEFNIPGAIRPGQPGVAAIQRGMPKPMGGPDLDENTPHMQEVIVRLQDSLGKLTSGPPQGAAQRAMAKLNELRASGRENTPHARRLANMLDQLSDAMSLAGQQMEFELPAQPVDGLEGQGGGGPDDDDSFLQELGY